MIDPTDAPGWARHELNLRLTGRRLAQLRAIAHRLPGRPTPTEAIDGALARSANDEGSLLSRMDEIEGSIEFHAAERRAVAARLEAAVKATQRSIADLHALIAAAISDPNGD